MKEHSRRDKKKSGQMRWEISNAHNVSGAKDKAIDNLIHRNKYLEPKRKEVTELTLKKEKRKVV